MGKRKISKAKARRVRQWREGAAAQLARVRIAKEQPQPDESRISSLSNADEIRRQP
jgi:hypothetical protein